MLPSSDIEKALSDVRWALAQNKFTFVPRTKNMQTMANLGITSYDVIDIVYNLRPHECVKGAVEDRDFPDSDLFWVFVTKVRNESVYIKFKILYQKDKSVKIVSFHIENMN